MVKFLFPQRGKTLFFFFLPIRKLIQMKENFHVSLYPSRCSTQKKIDTDCHSRRHFISRTIGGSVFCFGFFFHLVLPEDDVFIIAITHWYTTKTKLRLHDKQLI